MMPSPRPTGLAVRLALASLGWAGALAVVCAVGLVSLRDVSAVTHTAVTREMAILDDAAAFQVLLYQKGFVADYMLSGDASWLQRLEESRTAFAAALARARAGITSDDARRVVDQIEAEYAAYDAGRRQAVTLYEWGSLEEAKAALAVNHHHIERLAELLRSFAQTGRHDAEVALAAAERKTSWLAFLLVGTSLLGAMASGAVGFLWARRLTKPIYELQLRVESASARTRIQVDPKGSDLDDLAEHVGAIVAKLEDADALLTEQRHRLVQSEKLSAVGELAAKLAHEILNPLAGMKAAVQLLARSQPAAKDTADALGREIARVEDLVRRLVDYSRPLAPRVEVCTVSKVLDAAVEAAQPELKNVRVERREESGLPPLEADPLLLRQALANLLINAAQAMPDGGVIEIDARRADGLGRPHVSISVADEGPGIAAEHLERLFHPFFTTKPRGHGLGLAVSQNIALEHGGRIAARNRDGRRGAVFDLTIPVVR